MFFSISSYSPGLARLDPLIEQVKPTDMWISGWELGVTSQGGTVSGGEVAWDDGKEVADEGEDALGEVAGVGTTRESWTDDATAEALVPEASDCATSYSGSAP